MKTTTICIVVVKICVAIAVVVDSFSEGFSDQKRWFFETATSRGGSLFIVVNGSFLVPPTIKAFL